MRGNLKERFIGWRAGQISDPIERLRYLSRAARDEKRPIRTLLLIAAVAAIPLHLVSDARVRTQPPEAPRLLRTAAPPHAATAVWLVERAAEYEIYSNGLRIENRLAVPHHRRAYRPIDRGTGQLRKRIYEPAGIVFHSTESYQAPFDASRNRLLQETGEALLHYVRKRQSYHFLIDRFGRVHRIVVESDAANHAGKSVWADSRWIYLDLNNSFLGVAFEAQTGDDAAVVWTNKAQVRSAAVLVEMLRGKYGIPAQNCVTHAQVSVNPSNMQIGYHTDFGNRFAFEEVGLPDNSANPVPAVSLFGFTYAPTYLKATGAPLWKSLALAEEQIRTEALLRGHSPSDYRRSLQRHYRTLAANYQSQLSMEN